MSVFQDALGGTRLYPLTDRSISKLSHAAQVEQLNEGGARVVQLREKDLSPSEFYAEAVAAMQVARARGVKLIINDRVDIALAVRADGVHLGQTDLPPAVARRLLGREAIIGFSTHTLEQAIIAAELPVDYIALGPIFKTSTKKASELPVGLVELHRVREAIGAVPLVAIGGINSENCQTIIDAGADAVALISALWTSPDGPAERTRQLIQHL